VIEDEPGIARALKTNLSAHGFQVETADNGRAGLDSYKRRRPDLILLDLGLPDIDGKEIVREVRSDGATPIIVLSVRGAEREKVEALDLGADDYLTKPFGVDELLARIRVALRHTAAPDAGGRVRTAIREASSTCPPFPVSRASRAVSSPVVSSRSAQTTLCPRWAR